MKQFLCLLLAILLRGSTSNPDEDRLLKYLFSPQYQKNNVMTPPIHNISDYLDVMLSIQLRKILHVDDVEQVIKLQYFLDVEWKDYRLQWNKSCFGDLDVITVPSKQMWVPRLLLRNNAKQSRVHEVTPESDYVFLYSDGSCMWEPRYDLAVSHCDIDVTWFPFDQQNCSLQFLSWLLTIDNLHIDPRADYKNQSHYVVSDNWHYLGIQARKHMMNDYPELIFTLHIRRVPTYYIINIILPCCILSFIAVATFHLQPNCYDRLGLAVTIVLAITVYQIVINGQLPTTSKTPVINMYVTFVIVTTVCVVLFTIIVQRMALHAESQPLVAMPAWIKVLFCKCLATCLCMKPPSSPSLEPPLIYMKRRNVATGDRSGKKYENMKISTVESAENDSVRKILRQIRDRMQVCIERLDEQRFKEEKEEEMKNDWMLAAAVLDRICAFAFAIILVAGTVVFITLITTHIG